MNIKNKENLKEKANNILEITGNEQDKYAEERKLIFSIMENIKNEHDILILDKIINMFTRIVNLENEKNSYNTIMLILKEWTKQHVRKFDDDQNSEINLFLIKDKSDNSYTFFSRESLKNFVINDSNNFETEPEIHVIKNNNIDLEELINKLRDNK